MPDAPAPAHPPGGPPAPGSAYGVPRHRYSRGAAVLLALLLHGLLLWRLLAHDPLVMKPPPDGKEGTITFIAPLAQVRPPKPITPPQPKPLPKVQPKPKPPKPITRPVERAVRKPEPKPTPAPSTDETRTASAEPLTPAPIVAQQPAPAPSEDFSARIEANRRRRAEAQANDPAAQAAAETEDQRANRIARENVAFSRRKSPTDQEKDQSGGVFDVRNLHLHNAEFAFHGWSTNTQRNSLQIIPVDQGTEVDIETAVVRRIITFIRTMKPGEFVFESRRLGRAITLNAGVAYQAELEQFLMKEFFPTYVRTGSHG